MTVHIMFCAFRPKYVCFFYGIVRMQISPYLSMPVGNEHKINFTLTQGFHLTSVCIRCMQAYVILLAGDLLTAQLQTL